MAACLLDFAFLHGKKETPKFCLFDHALANQVFLDDISKKPEWYDKVKDLHGLWEGAWADGSFFSLK